MALNNGEKFPIPENVLAAVNYARDRNIRVVFMTCGIAGSGKSTLARNLEKEFGYVRLSVDKYIFEKYGVWKIGMSYNKPPKYQIRLQQTRATHWARLTLTPLGFPEVQYEKQQEEAHHWIKAELTGLLREGKKDIVLDLSLWAKIERQMWRDIVNHEGQGRYTEQLVVFKNSITYFQKRIHRRNKLWESTDNKEAEKVEGRPVSFDMFLLYCKQFQWPKFGDEGEITVGIS